jgi:4-hydroxythreonine-4-phosphate dehydrogenase
MSMALPIGLTMGEPAGIGGEISLKAWMNRGANGVPPFFMIDDPDRLSRIAAQMGWAIPIRTIESPDQAAAAFAEALPVLSLGIVPAVAPGIPDPSTAKHVEQSIRMGVELALAGKTAAVVTNPIHKHVMHQGGFAYPGHTEFLADLLGVRNREVMMLACDQLRVVPVSIHVSLQDAIHALDGDMIVSVTETTARALSRDFGIKSPRLAIAGLNPHAGENGDMGREDMDVIAPAVARLKAMGIDAVGPLPPDTMFHAQARTTYDAAICMYHDQALIPIKTLDFDGGVNVTLGLPIIRTSPDHGTAFGLAGTGTASERSLVAALRMAALIAEHRGHA